MVRVQAGTACPLNLAKIPLLSLGGWAVADGFKESLVVEPGYPFKQRQFDGLDGFPG